MALLRDKDAITRSPDLSIKLSGPAIPARSGEAKKVVILLHGYGSDGNDLISLAPYLQDVLPDALFIAPNAPHACDMNPSGYQWFPLAMDREISRLERIETTRPVIKSFLEDVWAQTGLSANDTILAGFSQGAMISLDSGLRCPDQLKGIISFSGGIVEPDTIGQSMVTKPPVCLVHGDSDEVVPLAMSVRGEQVLKAAGVDARLFISPNTGHSIAADGLEFARNFVSELII